MLKTFIIYDTKVYLYLAIVGHTPSNLMARRFALHETLPYQLNPRYEIEVSKL